MPEIPCELGFDTIPNEMCREIRIVDLNLARRYAAVGSALIWQAVAESWFTPTGEGMHRVTYYLENEDRGFFTAALEQGNRFQSAEVDGVQVRLPPAGTNLLLTIALPENQRFSVVELQWNTSSAEGWIPWIRQVPLPFAGDRYSGHPKQKNYPCSTRFCHNRFPQWRRCGSRRFELAAAAFWPPGAAEFGIDFRSFRFEYVV